MKTRTRIAIATGALAVLAAGCSDYNDDRARGDAPVGDRNEAPRDVIEMPDTFPNLVVVCDGTTRVYVTTRQAPPAVVPDHPACRNAPEIQEAEG